ncbi:hypothetical protein [Actinocorallia longicatena]|uniref:DUF3558 domain-containing protein n=1 Tax=Actinocorallia longicatena TaxID=111803 RepID=A0ABP6QKV5_9ACTN
MRADFDRVYSPPEPPSSRLKRARVPLAVLAGLAVAGGGVVLAIPMIDGGESGSGARPSVTAGPETTSPDVTGTDQGTPGPVPTTSASPSVSSPPVSSPAPTGSGGTLQELPDICGTVETATFLKWVPKGVKDAHVTAGAGSCGYSSPAGRSFRYLRLETRIGNNRNDIDPIGVARWSFAQDLQAQQKDTSSRTLLVAARTGLGEEAFQRFSVNKGEPTVTARVEARVFNVIVTVTYSRDHSGKPEKEQKSSLDVAASVVEEALRTYA